MTRPEIKFWRRVAEDLNIEIETPVELSLPDGGKVRASALVKHFGQKNGMIVDIDYATIKPHVEFLVERGFGFCGGIGEGAYDRAAMIDVLADWGWSGPADSKPDWLELNPL